MAEEQDGQPEIVAKPVEDVEQLSKDIAGGVDTTSVPKTPVTKLKDEIKGNEEDYKLSDEDLQLTIDQEGFDVEDAATPSDVKAPTAKEGLGQIDDEDISKTKTGIENLEGTAATSTGPTEEIEMDDIILGLSDGATAEEKTEDLDEKATVQYQMSELMASIEEGKPPPAWASGAVRKVSAIMQSRGMGSSSMAASAMVQSVMEAGIPIATADAMSYGKIQLQNLANSQATALQNAATVAAMDTAELNARLTGAVANAKNFLSIDLGNLTNEQAINTLDYQAAVKSVFTDAAQENVTEQINAKNEMQVEEFYDEIGVQVETANANREAAQNQFNASEENAMTQYKEGMDDSREKFNTNMSYAVDQSNVQWNREITTADTAVQNETNRIDTQNSYNATQSAINALWQKYRDNASFNFQKTENGLNRKQQLGLMALEFSYNMELLDKQEKDDLIEMIGEFVSGWGDDS
tara:strand:+ start:16 stop:1413 length:1398 start_codon:yes stop_codon:yes gene_type:complete